MDTHMMCMHPTKMVFVGIIARAAILDSCGFGGHYRCHWLNFQSGLFWLFSSHSHG